MHFSPPTFSPLFGGFMEGSFCRLESDITLCGGGSEILGSWSGSFLGVARHYSQNAAHLKHSQLPCFIVKLQVPPASIRGMPFRKNWVTQPTGRSKFFVLPLPGGVLRVEQPRETLSPSRIAQGGSDGLPKVPLAGREEQILLTRCREEVVLCKTV